MTTINFKKLFSIKDIKEEVGFPNSIESIKLGYDHNIYILLKQEEPERIIRGIASFPNTEADTKYIAIILTIDWDHHLVINKRIITLGHLKMNYSILQPLGDEFLIVGLRCRNLPEGPELNAMIFDEKGSIVREFCLGDGITETLTIPDKKIITGYFDEGILGNFGWSDPIGKCGIIEWDKDGNQIWKNTTQTMYDVFGMDYFKNKLYYNIGELIETNMENEEKVIKMKGVNSCLKFTFSKDEKKLIVDGFIENNSLYIYDFGEEIPKNKRKAEFLFDGNKINDIENVNVINLRESKIICKYNDFIYGTKF